MDRQQIERYSHSVTVQLNLQELRCLKHSTNMSIEKFCRQEVLSAASKFATERQLDRTFPIVFSLSERESQLVIEKGCYETILHRIGNQQKVLLVQRRQVQISKKIKIFGTVCLVIGGFLVASNTSISKFGFLFLASSSSSMALACFLAAEQWNGRFFVLTFLVVDCFGIFNWLIRG
ncbi:hypothetical protein C7B80_21840 [Cyanosarcina cf. burmensis CCALA 770]|nr:hypothetical protein C7B80_21840 [Cyanosarcina cf. burmensis CCALA 770]